jgi:hypothetical protein
MMNLPPNLNILVEQIDRVADLLVAAGYCAYELLDANEPAIALEIMCNNLHEFNCHIPARAYELLAEVGGDLNADSKYWETLKSYCRWVRKLSV